MNLVTIRRARMIPVFLHALLRHFGDFVGGAVGVLRKLATPAANAGVVIMVAASRTAAIFLFMSSSFGALVN